VKLLNSFFVALAFLSSHLQILGDLLVPSVDMDSGLVGEDDKLAYFEHVVL
jgi:hypothetical protein